VKVLRALGLIFLALEANLRSLRCNVHYIAVFLNTRFLFCMVLWGFESVYGWILNMHENFLERRGLTCEFGEVVYRDVEAGDLHIYTFSCVRFVETREPRR
jgi:hypothetical protein